MSEAELPEVTVVGIGVMGSAVAARLLETGHVVSIMLRRETEASRTLVEAGARVVSTLSSAVIVDCLPDDAAVQQVFTTRVIHGMDPLSVHISMATIGVALSTSLEEAHWIGGSGYVAAPVLGRPDAAVSGALQVIAAGDADAVGRARPVLDALAARVRVLERPAHTAHLVKLAVNLNLVHAVQALGASIGLAESGGVDAATFVEILTTTAYTGTVHRGYGSRIAERGYVPAGFSGANALKDLDLAIAAAREAGIDLNSGELRQVLADAATTTVGLDWSAFAERYRSVG